jgi:purine-cytosine permease-like protein
MFSDVTSNFACSTALARFGGSSFHGASLSNSIQSSLSRFPLLCLLMIVVVVVVVVVVNGHRVVRHLERRL